MPRAKKVDFTEQREHADGTPIKTLSDADALADLKGDPRPSDKPKFKVLKPVLGYKKGDVFEADYHSVRFQLKHKSIEAV